MSLALLPTLLLPGALPSPDWLGRSARAACLQTPGLRSLATRRAQVAVSAASVDAIPEPGHERWLRQRFGLSEHQPFAACGPAADGCGQAQWRLDPVHLHLGRDHLVLTDPSRLDLTDEESTALRAAITPLLAEEGFELIGCASTRWALVPLKAGQPLRLRTHSLAGALGRNIDAYLPQGADARRWRRILNEVQMTWHIHPVNAQREAQGQSVINGLWIEGPCPHETADLSAVQLRAAGSIANRSPHASHALIVDDGRGAIHLDDQLMQAQLSGDPQVFRQAWARLDAQHFQAIARQEAPWQHGVTLVLTGDSGWRSILLPPAKRWRLSALWRRTHEVTWLDPIDAREQPV